MTVLKLPKIKLPKLDKRKKKFLLGGLIVAALFVTSSYMLSPEGDRDIFAFGTPNYQINTLGSLTPLTTDSVVNSIASDLKISFTWGVDGTPPSAGDFHAILRTSVLDNIEDVYSTRSGNTYTFNFGLLNAHAGTFTYYLTFYAVGGSFFYSGNSFTFQVSNLVQVIDPPTFVSTPDDVGEAVVDYAYTLSWKFKYTESCDVTLEQDGVVKDTRAFAGSSFTQDYSYVFTPPTDGDWIFRFTLDPTSTVHSSLVDEVVFGAITFEDYTMIDEIPGGLENVGVVMDGTLPNFGLALHHEWLIGTIVPPDVHAYPKQGDLSIKLAFTLAGVSIDILGDTKVVMFNSAGERLEFPMTTQFTLTTWFGISFSSWKEVVIDLDAIPAGEYACEVRTVSPANNVIYRIATFNLSVNTFPIGFVVTYGGIILLISAVSIISIRVLREAKGWWGFQGKYNK